MERIISAFVGIFLGVLVCGVIAFSIFGLSKVLKNSNNPQNRMLLVEDGGVYAILKDKETKILYIKNVKGGHLCTC